MNATAGRWPLGASTLGTPGDPLSDVIDTLMSNGASCVELRAAPDALVNTDLDAHARAQVRARLESAGIAVLSVASGVRIADLPDQESETDDPVTDSLVAHLQLASDLGAAFVRVFPGAPVDPAPFDQVPATVDDLSEVDQLAARRLARVGAAAASLGVQPVLETHDSHPRGADIARILGVLDREQPGHAVGAIWDVLHPWRTGEELPVTWEALRPYLLNGRGYVQIKDVASRTVLTPVLQGTGIVPLAQVLSLLRAGSYAGPLSLEWERTWYPEVAPLATALPAAAAALASG